MVLTHTHCKDGSLVPQRYYRQETRRNAKTANYAQTRRNEGDLNTSDLEQLYGRISEQPDNEPEPKTEKPTTPVYRAAGAQGMGSAYSSDDIGDGPPDDPSEPYNDYAIHSSEDDLSCDDGLSDTDTDEPPQRDDDESPQPDEADDGKANPPRRSSRSRAPTFKAMDAKAKRQSKDGNAKKSQRPANDPQRASTT